MKRKIKCDEGEPCEKALSPVHPDNKEAWEVFIACSTQWEVSRGLRTGIRYESVEAIMRLYKVRWPLDCFEKIRVLEAEELSRQPKPKQSDLAQEV